MTKIYNEIDSSNIPYAVVDSVSSDLQNGLVSNQFASIARGYPEEEADLAAEDQAKRLARIQSAQTPHPISNQINPDPNKLEKKKANDTTYDTVPTDKTRGNGKI